MGIPGTGARGTLILLAAVLAVGNGPAPQSGSITVVLRTTATSRPPLRVTVDASICGPSVPDESLLVDHGRVANAVVSLPGLPATHPSAVDVVNDRCRFAPHVALAAPGAAMRMVSRDQTLHTVHAHQSGRSLFNVGLPIPGLMVTRPAPGPGVVALKCNTHPWMSGYVVTATSRAALSGADGTARFDQVPDGTHAIRVWHETLGEGSASVTVARGAAASVEITLGM